MKFAEDRPFADPEKAARKLLEIANTVELVQDGRIYIELLNGPFLFSHGGSPAEFGAGLALAIERGWLEQHESGTFVRFTQAGAGAASGVRDDGTERGSIRRPCRTRQRRCSGVAGQCGQDRRPRSRQGRQVRRMKDTTVSLFAFVLAVAAVSHSSMG